MSNPSVAVDFDGCIHPMTKGWVGVTPDPEPPDPHVPIVLRTLNRRFKVIVFSARASFPEGNAGIEEWLKANHLNQFVSEVTAIKPAAVAYVGRWVIPFRGDWTEIFGGLEESDRETALRAKRRGPMPTLTDAEWGYVGGLIDGEGCISGGANQNGNAYVRLNISNQHRDVLEWAMGKFGGSIHTRQPPGYRHPISMWYLSGARIAVVLEGCLDRGVLRMKEHQARIALEFIAACRYNGRDSGSFTRLIQQQRIVAISSLNQRGVATMEPIVVDDRAVPFTGDWSAALAAIEKLAKKPTGPVVTQPRGNP